MHPRKEFMEAAIALARKGVVGAVIVKDGVIISRGINTIKEDGQSTHHAEINALHKASEALKTHRLEGCWVYSTFEPCPMCAAACVWSRVAGIVFGANINDTTENLTQRVSIPCREILANGTPKVELHEDFMRKECKEAMK